MSARTARWIGGFRARVVGAVALDLFPPVGLLEVVAAIVVLTTHRRGAALAALFPTGLILLSAILVMVTVGGLDNPIMWPVAMGASLTAIALVRGGALTSNARPQLH